MTDTHARRGLRVRDFPLIPTLLFGVVLALIIGIGAVTITADMRVTEHTDCTVTDKDRAAGQDGKSQMRVYTSCGTFAIADSLIIGRFDSADLYGSVEVGSTYDITVRGYRVPILSWFPNIETLDKTA